MGENRDVCLGHQVLKNTHEILRLRLGRQAGHMAKHNALVARQKLLETGRHLQKSTDSRQER